MAASEEKIKDYLKMSQTIILATTNKDGAPDLRTLGGYGLSEYVIYFSTIKDSHKVAQLNSKKDVAVLIQHENQYISKFFNVTIYGEAVLLENDQEFEYGKNLILARKPSLKIRKDTHFIFKIIPKKLKVLDFSEQNQKERSFVIEF